MAPCSFPCLLTQKRARPVGRAVAFFAAVRPCSLAILYTGRHPDGWLLARFPACSLKNAPAQSGERSRFSRQFGPVHSLSFTLVAILTDGSLLVSLPAHSKTRPPSRASGRVFRGSSALFTRYPLHWSPS